MAVYATDIRTARQVWAAVVSAKQKRTFGTVILDNGEEIDWVDMASVAVLPDDEQ